MSKKVDSPFLDFLYSDDGTLSGFVIEWDPRDKKLTAEIKEIRELMERNELDAMVLPTGVSFGTSKSQFTFHLDLDEYAEVDFLRQHLSGISREAGHIYISADERNGSLIAEIPSAIH